MEKLKFFPEKVFEIGPVDITDTVLVTWLVMAVISIVCYVATRHLELKPTKVQELLEAFYDAVDGTVRDVVPVDPALVVPVLGTLWILIGVSNLIGLIPGLSTPTADINATFALAVVAYSMSHVFGIKTRGLMGYLEHYKEPTWLLLPFHIMAEITRTIALAVRLFGNMLSGEMIALILLGIAGFLVPVPFHILHIIIGLIQAYIFGMLTLVFIAGGVGQKPQPGG
jgi:F-type H+-transporting ATPase subunit a